MTMPPIRKKKEKKKEVGILTINQHQSSTDIRKEHLSIETPKGDAVGINFKKRTYL